MLVGFILLIPLGSANSADTEYYVDDATGDDLDNGTTEALAWATIQKALDTFTLDADTDDITRINVKNTNTYVITATIDGDTTTGVSNRPLVIECYSSTIGDGGQCIIDANDGAPQAVNVVNQDSTRDYYIWKGFTFRDSSSTCFSSDGDYNKHIDNVYDNCGHTGAYNTNNSMYGCEVKGTSDDGVYAFDVYFSYIHDTGDYGIYGGSLQNSIIDTSPDDGAGYITTVIGNTIYNTTASPNVHLNNMGVELNNIYYTSSTYNNDSDGECVWIAGYNVHYDYTGSATRYGGLAVDLGNYVTTDPDLVDPANGTASSNDFNLGSSTTVDDQGYPTAYKGISNTLGHFDIGAMPYEETGGAAATVHSYGFAN